MRRIAVIVGVLAGAVVGTPQAGAVNVGNWRACGGQPFVRVHHITCALGKKVANYGFRPGTLRTWIGGFHCTRQRNAENVIWLYTCVRNRGHDGVFFPDPSAGLSKAGVARRTSSAITFAQKRRSKVFIACGKNAEPAPTIKRVAPFKCAMRAYDTTQLTYVNVSLRRLKWKGWGNGRATATGQYAISGHGWNPVTLTVSHLESFHGKLAGRFYVRLDVLDTCACGFLGPGRGFSLDATPSE